MSMELMVKAMKIRVGNPASDAVNDLLNTPV